MASWFDEQTQPPPYLSPDQLARVGITDPGQGPNRGSLAEVTSSGPAPSTVPTGTPSPPAGPTPGRFTPAPSGQGTFTAYDANGNPYQTTGARGQDGRYLPVTGTFLQGGNVVQPYQFSGGVPPPTAQTGGTTTTTAQKSGNIGADWQAFIASKGYTGTYARTNMPAIVAEFNQAYGYTAKPGNPNASGQIDTVDFGDGGGWRDLIHGGDDAWQNIADSPGGAGGAGGMADGSLLAPWTTPFTPRDPSQIAQDPAYQFQLGQGTQAINRSAAARGTLLTGGTLKSLDQYGQGLASTFNDKYYARDLGEYQLAQQNFYANQDRPFNKLSQLATLGKPTALPTPTVP